MTINPQPKPDKRDRKRGERIDYTALTLAKNPPDRSESFLDYVRSQTCATWSTQCDGRTEAAHLFVIGKSIKASDFFTVPLCSACHRRQHQQGIATFQINEGVNLWEVSSRLLVGWIRRNL